MSASKPEPAWARPARRVALLGIASLGFYGIAQAAAEKRRLEGGGRPRANPPPVAWGGPTPPSSGEPPSPPASSTSAISRAASRLLDIAVPRAYAEAAASSRGRPPPAGLYAWGDNARHLAAATTSSVTSPSLVLPSLTFRSVATSERLGAAISTDGAVYVWGASSASPVLVARIPSAVSVACTSSSVFVLTKEGGVLEIGNASDAADVSLPSPSLIGRLTGGVATSRLEGVRRQIATPAGSPVVALSAGEHHLVALTADGHVYACASDARGNAAGQLGNGQSEDETATLTTWSPVNLPALASQVACGALFSLARLADGTVATWGGNAHLQQCTGNSPDHVVTPRLVRGLPQKCTLVAAGGSTSAFVVESGADSQVYMAGDGQLGQLGTGQWNHVMGKPVKVKEISDKKFYDQDEKRVKPIRIKEITVGTKHCAGTNDILSIY